MTLEEQFSKDDKIKSVEDTGYTPPDGETTKWMHDIERELYWSLYARFKGGRLNENSQGKYEIIYPDNPTAFMNDLGIEETITIINAFISKNHGLSDYDTDRINDICRDTNRELVHFYAINMEKFGMTPSKASLVVTFIMNQLESIFRKSKGGLSLKLAGQMEHTTIQKQEKEKKNFFF